MIILSSKGGDVMFGKRVLAAEVPTIGTTYYRLTEDDVIEGLEQKECNIFAKSVFDSVGWDCLNFQKNLFGSKLIDNVLYVCVTDGKKINIDDYEVDPEKALNDFEIEELEDYIEDGTPETVRRFITTHEMNKFDVEQVSINLLEEGYTLKQVFDAATEAELI